MRRSPAWLVGVVLGGLFGSGARAEIGPRRIWLTLGNLDSKKVHLTDGTGKGCVVPRPEVEKAGYRLTASERIWVEVHPGMEKSTTCSVIQKAVVQPGQMSGTNR